MPSEFSCSQLYETQRPVEKGCESSTATANIFVQCWNRKDLQELNADAAKSLVPPEFGNLELVSEQQPSLIAKVDATLERQSGTLTVTELDGNERHKKGEKLSVHLWSGNEQYGIGYAGGTGADGKYDDLKNHGPLPKGEYLIGNGYENADLLNSHPGGDPHWYRLYGSDGKGGFSYEKLANGRGGFNLHTGLESDGCGTIPSEVQQSNSAYPSSTQYNKLKDFLDSTTPYEYKPGDTYRGQLHVR